MKYIGKEKEYHREYYYKRRKAIIDYLGGKCVKCEETNNLEIDHVDPSNKSFNISKRLSLKNNKDEIDKCQLLCENCHDQKTAIENTGITHGTPVGWMKSKCQCDLCQKAKRAWHDKRNEKRRKPRVPIAQLAGGNSLKKNTVSVRI